MDCRLVISGMSVLYGFGDTASELSSIAITDVYEDFDVRFGRILSGSRFTLTEE
jgi:hypothetical protein